MSLTNIEKNLRQQLPNVGNRDNSTVTIVSESGTAIDHVVKVMDLANRLKVKAILATEPLP